MIDLRHPNKHLIIGIIIVGVGVILLLDQLGLAEANEIFRLWPLILIYFGVQKLISAPNVTSRFWGAFITLLGISFQLEALGLRGIRFGTIWPVFLICAGVLMVWRHYERTSGPYYNSQVPMPPPPPGPPNPDTPNPQAPNHSSDASAAAPGQAQASFSAQSSTPGPGATSTPPPPPPPPNYGSSWDRHAWKQQRAWEKFQRRMEHMNARFNENPSQAPPNTNWQPPRPPNPHWAGSGNWQDSSQPVLDDVFIFWGGRRRILSKNFIGGDIVAIFGGFEIDLTQADFTAPEIVIEMVAIFGGGELRVPPNWEVIVENVGIFGGTSDRTWHPNAVPPAATTPAPPVAPVKRLIIKGVAIFGGLTIKN